MIKGPLAGIAAGALGTVALNITTYLDMALRGRASSGTPAKLVDILAKKAGISLAPAGVGPDDKTAANRESGIGALLGYATGLGVGLVYSLIRSDSDDAPVLLAGLGLGAAAMAASDIPLVAFGLTNPAEWGASGWASDLVPHVVYGLITASAYNALVGS